MRPKLHHLPIILSLLAVLISIPATVYLVKQRQEVRKRAEEIPLNFTLNPNHPRLLIDATEVVQIKEKIRTQPWARNQFGRYQLAADCLVGRETAGCSTWTPQVEIPGESTLSSHNYLCPAIAGAYAGDLLDVSKISPDPEHPGSHLHYCTGDGQYYSGSLPVYSRETPPAGGRLITLEDLWRFYKHNEYQNALLYLGLTYQLSTQPDSVKILYAQKAKEILLAYARKYPTWKIHDNYGCWEGDLMPPNPPSHRCSSQDGRVTPAVHAGKMYSQSLGDANWITGGAAAGYDLVYDSEVFTPAEKTLIENNLFKNMVNTIRRNTAASGGNWQALHNSAIGMVGFLLNDTSLINEAIDGRMAPPSQPGGDPIPIWGFKKQICELTDSDGVWNEGTGYYHYVMSAYIPLAESARHAGTDLYDLDASGVCGKSTPRTFRKMFEVAEKLILPYSWLPSLEDAGVFATAPAPDYYDLAFTRFGGNFYPWLTNKLDPRRPRLFSLLYGQPTLPTPAPPVLSSNILREVGYGVLRIGSGDNASYALLDFGPFGGHGHPDKLDAVFYQNQKLVLPDLGNTQYGSPLYSGWDLKTLSHNTLGVDGQSQPNKCIPGQPSSPVCALNYTPVSGRLLFCNFDSVSPCRNDAQSPFKVIKAAGGTAYPNVSATRMLALNQDYLIDSLEVSSTNSQSHTYDLPFHGNVLTRLSPNNMILDTSLSLTSSTTGYNNNGYQYLTATQSATLAASPAPFWAKWRETTRTQSPTQEQATQLQTGTPLDILESGGEPMDFGSSNQEDLTSTLTTTTPSNSRVQITGLNPASGDKVFSTVGPFPPLGNKQPFLIWRKQGTNAKFVSVIELYTEGQRKISNATLTQNAQGQDIVTVNFVDSRRDTFNLVTMSGSVITPTPTPTPTLTPTPTVTPTPTPQSSFLNLRLKFQGIPAESLTPRNPKTIALTLKRSEEQIATYSATLNYERAGGTYRGQILLSRTPPSTYTALVKGEGYLRKNFGNLPINPGENLTPDTWLNFPQKAGDYYPPDNSDNHLTLNDLGVILAIYRSLSVPVTPTTQIYDVNGNGFITIDDISLVLANYIALDVPGDNN